MPPLKRSITIADETPRKLSRSAKVRTKKRTKAFKSITSSQLRKVTHPFYSTHLLAMGGANPSLVDIVFRGNDMYDPQHSWGGEQPFGFDQMTPLYKKFYVQSSRIRVQGQNINNNSSLAQLLVWADTNSASPSTVKGAVERSIAFSGAYPFLNNYAAGITDVSRKAYTRRLLTSGIDEDNNHGTSGVSPLEQWYWHVCVVLTDPSQTRSIQLQVAIIFDAIWTESNLNTTS